jgi:rhodanese-related sulfurtransferase
MYFSSTSVCAQEDDPYCGLNCVFAAAEALGQDNEFEPLIDRKFLSNRFGSTAIDLIAAGKHLGVNVTPYKGLSVTSLVKARDPLVLHVSPYGDVSRYSHWVLFLGSEKELAKIVDDDGVIALVPIAEILARWDGLALAVHVDASPLGNYSGVELSNRLSWFALILGITACFTFLPAKFETKTIVFVVFASGVMICFVSIWNHAPMATNRNSVGYLVTGHLGNRFERVEFGELSRLLEDNPSIGIFLVDARFASDSKWGSIPSSINIPVDSNRTEIARKVKGIPLARPVVVYCLSDQCGFDQAIANKLAAFGFKDIRLYEPGWQGWLAETSKGEN